MSERFSLRGIHQSFDQASRRLEVLKGVDLTIAAGETVALLGPSGSGKSCLLHIAGLLEKPASGEILVNGRVLPTDDDGLRTRGRLQHIGFVYQFHNLLPEFSALENVMLPLRLRGLAGNAARATAGDILAKLGLTDRLEHLPAQLSGGEQQRVAIARALVAQPDVILADEPTG
ncbi:MAG: ABC transporter ATP-binding protein, partial [Pseudomonadota bacterium]|nr:ABC transporter ATP-binding protein [Pseudomonadota bacterium]